MTSTTQPIQATSDFATIDALAAKVDAFLKAVIAADDRALSLCPFGFSAAKVDDVVTAVIGEGNAAVTGTGATLAVAVRDALYSSPTLRARLIELEACP